MVLFDVFLLELKIWSSIDQIVIRYISKNERYEIDNLDILLFPRSILWFI